ncbi:MAG: (Fe-S)-binding protein [Promethearchaeota archaeon]
MEIKEIRRKKLNPKVKGMNEVSSKSIYISNLKSLLYACYQCGFCSGICQLSRVEKFAPSRIIQQIREGYEDQVLKSGVLWDCLTCNSCLQNCPELVNFAEIVRNARYKMRKLYNQDPKNYCAHEGIYTDISEIMSKSYITPNRSLEWVPKDCKISNKGKVLYFVGCIPFFNFEFQNLDSIVSSTLSMIYQAEKAPIVVLKEECCCGHDLYWGHGKFKTFLKLAKKNIENFKKSGVSTIITACAECYRTLKVEYSNYFENFADNFEVYHIIEYLYEKWKEHKIELKKLNQDIKKIPFTYHDPCRLSRFLPKDSQILNYSREIFQNLNKIGYEFKEMEHNQNETLCCGVCAWMNCGEESKALRYKRMLEAKAAGDIMITSCPKCKIHFSCLQNDYEELSSIEILDFSELLFKLIDIIEPEKGIS